MSQQLAPEGAITEPAVQPEAPKPWMHLWLPQLVMPNISRHNPLCLSSQFVDTLRMLLGRIVFLYTPWVESPGKDEAPSAKSNCYAYDVTAIMSVGLTVYIVPAHNVACAMRTVAMVNQAMWGQNALVFRPRSGQHCDMMEAAFLGKAHVEFEESVARFDTAEDAHKVARRIARHLFPNPHKKEDKPEDHRVYEDHLDALVALPKKDRGVQRVAGFTEPTPRTRDEAMMCGAMSWSGRGRARA